MPRHQAVGKRVRVLCLTTSELWTDQSNNDAGSMEDLIRGTLALCYGLVECRSHFVQRSCDASQTFHHVLWCVPVTVQGGHFIEAGESLNKLSEALEQLFLLKKMPTVGPPQVGGTNEGHLIDLLMLEESNEAERCRDVITADHQFKEATDSRLQHIFGGKIGTIDPVSRISESKSLAEGAVRQVMEGTSSGSVQCGLHEKWSDRPYQVTVT